MPIGAYGVCGRGVTDLADAVRECDTGTLRAAAQVFKDLRSEATSRGVAAIMNAVLCAAVDEIASRRRAEVELVEVLTYAGTVRTDFEIEPRE